MSLNLKSSQDGTKAIIGVNGGEQFQVSSNGDLEIAGKIKSQSGAALTSDSPMVVDVNSSQPALRVTQTGSGNAIVVEDSTNPDASVFSIDSLGQMRLGVAQSNDDLLSTKTAYFLCSGIPRSQIGYVENANNGTSHGIFLGTAYNTASSEVAITFGGADNSNITRHGSTIVAGRDGEWIGYPGQSATTAPGNLQFWTRSPYGEQAERMRITSGGTVGIGTTTPASYVKLDVAGTIQATRVVATTFSNAEYNDFITVDPADDSISFSSNDVEKMVITSGSGYNKSAPVVIKAQGGGNNEYTSLVTGIGEVNQGQLEFRHGRSLTSLPNRYSILQAWSNQLANPVPLILNPDGSNIGIGTKSPHPDSLLHVAGSHPYDIQIQVENTNPTGTSQIVLGPMSYWNSMSYLGDVALWRQGSSTNGGALYAGLSSLNIGSAQPRNIGFVTNNSTRMIVTSGGRIGIGVIAPEYQLQLSTDSAAKPTTTTWTVASDERIKENIEVADIDRCYEIVKGLPLKRYTWKTEVFPDDVTKDRSKLGWIAQEVEKVFPKAVDTVKYDYDPVYETTEQEVTDRDGNVTKRPVTTLVGQKTIEDLKTLNADQIYAVMYGAIQKLMAVVEQQQEDIKALKQSVN